MSITLSDGTTTVTLHPDLYWEDENSWHPVEQTVERVRVAEAELIQSPDSEFRFHSGVPAFA